MADIFEKILMVKKSPIFSEVNTEDLRIVAREMEEESYFSGDRIFNIDEYGDHMYIIENGKVGISLSSEKKPATFIATLETGECFGEMNLLDELPRSASAHVLEDTKLLSLEKTKLRALIINYPQLSMGMLKGLSLRLRGANTSRGSEK